MKRTTLVAFSALAVVAGASLIVAARAAKMRTLADTTVRSVASTTHAGALLRAIAVARGKESKQVMYLEKVKPGSPGVVERQQLVKARYGKYDQMRWKAGTLHFRMTVGERFRDCRVKPSRTRAKPVARCDRKWQKRGKKVSARK